MSNARIQDIMKNTGYHEVSVTFFTTVVGSPPVGDMVTGNETWVYQHDPEAKNHRSDSISPSTCILFPSDCVFQRVPKLLL